MIKRFIGIDPDVDGSGVAFLEVDRAPGQRPVISLTLQNVTFADLIARFKEWADDTITPKIVVEAGYLNGTNWHIPNKCGTRAAAEIGRRTGRNHQIAIDMIDVARSFGLDVIEQRPFAKCWKGKDRKITHEEFAKITGYQKRNNQETRDAGLLAWITAGLPVKI